MRRFVFIVICAVLGAACGEPQEVESSSRSCTPMTVQRPNNQYHLGGDPDGLGIIVTDIFAPCGGQVTAIAVGLYRIEVDAWSFTRVPICEVLSCSQTIELRAGPAEGDLVPTVLDDAHASGAGGISYNHGRDGGDVRISPDIALELWVQLRDTVEDAPEGSYTFIVESLDVLDDAGSTSTFRSIVSTPFTI